MNARRATALGNIRAAAKGYLADPLLRYRMDTAGGRGGMSPPQKDFHISQSRKRAFIAGNKLGKSYAGGAEAWFHLLADHPFRDTPPPGSEGWLLCPDLQTGWRTVSKAMRELQPPDVLDPACKYVEGVGYLYRGLKIIKVSDAHGGGLLIGKGCEQTLLALEGARVQWAWVDEPPKEGHFYGLRARLAMDMGPLWITATPIGRPVAWLRNLVEGSSEESVEPEEGWDVWHVELTEENAPHRTPEDIAAQRSECSPWEFRQRILSEWDGLTADRWVSGFTEGNLFDEDDAPTTVENIGIGWDHGERPGKSICYLVAYDGNAVWVLDEYSNTDRSTPLQEAEAIREMLARWGLDLYGVTEARGDSNSAGRLGMGFSMNDLYMRAFAELVGSSRAPFQIQVPYKKRGSVSARVRLVSNACVDGRLRVNRKCARLIHTLRHWRGANDDLKDPFDAMGYISEVYLAPALIRDAPGRMIIA
jgi:hypothetical protein